MSTAMDQTHHIRELFYRQGMNISEIAKQTGYNWKTVKKYIDMADFNEPEVRPASEQTFCPKLEPYKAIIKQWLVEDKSAPRKQRHTAKRVHKRLSKEVSNFDCSYRLVAKYVKVMKEQLNHGKEKGKLPLIHYPGEAQADFGAADFYENGRHHSGKYLVLSFPHSNQGFPQLFYGENMECLLEGLDAIFRHIGGVPSEIWFDNTKTIVTKVIMGGEREVTERFQRFREHYGFKAVFTNCNAGWEKGNVENKVGYERRNFLVPVPRFLKRSYFNEQLLVENDADGNRDHYLKDGTITDLFHEDQAQLLPLPCIPFSLEGHRTIKTNGWGKFTLYKGMHEYSVSPKHTDMLVHLRLTSSTVTVLDDNLRVIVKHKRLYGDSKQSSMDWIPYLSYIGRHPRALMNTGIYEMMPPIMRTYLKECPNSERGRILKTIAELTQCTGFEGALQTVDQAIQYQATDADSLTNLHRRLFADIPELPPMNTSPGIPHLEQMPVDLTIYDLCLVKGGLAVNE